MNTRILALHGLGAHGGQLRDLLGSETADRWPVMAPDQRGHGRCALSTDTERLRISTLADDALEHVEAAHHQGASVFLVGVSLGAAVAVDLLARRHPRVLGALLVRPAWLWAACPPNLAVFDEVAALLEQHGRVGGRAAFLASPAYAALAGASPAAARAILGQFEDPRARELVARLRRLPRSAPSRPQAPLGRRVMVLTSPEDPVHPEAVGVRLASDLGVEVRSTAARYDDPVQHALDVRTALDELLGDH